MSGRAVPDAVAWFVRKHGDAWKAANPTKPWADLAKAVGVSEAQISDMRAGNRGIGHKTATGMAAVFGIPWEDFQARAEEEYRKHRAAQETATHKPPRYKNQVLARQRAGPETPARALHQYDSLQLFASEDPPVSWWTQQLLSIIARVEWEDAHPEAAEAAAEANEKNLKIVERDAPGLDPAAEHTTPKRATPTKPTPKRGR